MEDTGLIKLRDYLGSLPSMKLFTSNPEKTEAEISFVKNEIYFYIEYKRGNYKVFDRKEKLLLETDNVNFVIKLIKEKK